MLAPLHSAIDRGEHEKYLFLPLYGNTENPLMTACNVELCMFISSIKYILKYVHKNCDQATFALCSDQVDEISEYQNACYVSSNEAAWRITGVSYL